MRRDEEAQRACTKKMILAAYRRPGVTILPEAVCELPNNLTYTYMPSTTPDGGDELTRGKICDWEENKVCHMRSVVCSLGSKSVL